jgi:hypothetical protein
MTKKNFIALADTIRCSNGTDFFFTGEQIARLADFCHSQNTKFKRERWIGYINGENGPSGGKKLVLHQDLRKGYFDPSLNLDFDGTFKG